MSKYLRIPMQTKNQDRILVGILKTNILICFLFFFKIYLFAIHKYAPVYLITPVKAIRDTNTWASHRINISSLLQTNGKTGIPAATVPLPRLVQDFTTLI